MSRPNIVFYFSDQQRWDTLGCYGQPLRVTPNLDALAANGTRYENAFTCQPVCGPARACLQTGRYATEVGCEINGRALPFGSVKTLAQSFNEAGYATAYVGKWHLATGSCRGYKLRNERHTPRAQGRIQGLLDGRRCAGVHQPRL